MSEMTGSDNQGVPGGSAGGSQPATAITPELVRQVADKVFILLRRDLQIAAERKRSGPNHGVRRLSLPIGR